jgi:hypothetical protein
VEQCKCGAPLGITQLPPIRGTEDEVIVTIAGLPCRACPSGHERWLAGVLFHDHLLARLYATILPVARARGVFRKTWHCPRCGDPVAPAGYSGSAGGRIELPDLPPFLITVEAPLVDCAACGTALLWNKDGDAVFKIDEAIARAIAGADVRS